MAIEQQIASLLNEVNNLRLKMEEMKRARNIETLLLNPRENIISGNFQKSSRNVCIELNATDNNFSVVLPDAKTTEDIIFRLRKVDITSNIITITTIAGQTINNCDTQILSSEGDNMPIYAIQGNWKIA